MEKFTKGPWHADKDFKAIYNAQCNYICDWPLNNEHDKHLIAAAPEMYAELLADVARITKILETFTGLKNEPLNNELSRKIKLLAKARGE
jgi:hypothetical protein